MDYTSARDGWRQNVRLWGLSMALVLASVLCELSTTRSIERS